MSVRFERLSGESTHDHVVGCVRLPFVLRSDLGRQVLVGLPEVLERGEGSEWVTNHFKGHSYRPRFLARPKYGRGHIM